MQCRNTGIRLLLLMVFVGGCATPPAAPPAISPAPTGTELLSALQEVLVDSVAQARPAVVSIVALDVTPINGDSSKLTSRVDGTGFIYDPDGLLYTCAHVVNESRDITVRLASGDEVKAEVVGADPGTDIAVLKIPADRPLPILTLADSKKVRPGQFAIALGHPFFLDFTATMGIVSATGRNLQEIVGYSRRSSERTIRYEDYIQTDAWINRGSSGGPLLGVDGKVLGMNSMIRAAKDGVSSGPGFAIPSHMLVRIGQDLTEHGRVSRGWLGVGLQSHEKGVRLFRVLNGTPADRAGLSTGDIILKYNGQDVLDRTWLQHEIANTRVGTTIPFTVLRANLVKVVNVTIEEMPDEYAGRRRPMAAGDPPPRPNQEN